MSIKKTLTNIVLAGALALGGTGCGRNPEYDFKGKIGNEYVECFETTVSPGLFTNPFTYLTNLRVTKEDGSKILYHSGNDFKLDYIIIVGENVTRYDAGSSNPICKEIVQKEQKEFDSYLAKIIEIKTAPLNKE